MSLLLYQVRQGSRRGYARMLEAFWDEAALAGLDLPRHEPITAQAFSAARHKLEPEAVRGLIHTVAGEFHRAHGQDFLWHGRRLLAADGATRTLQASRELWREFGGHTTAHYPQTRVSALFDVLAELPLDVVAGPYGCCERKQLAQMIEQTRDGDVVVLDRGYPSFDVFTMLLESRLDFVARMPTIKGFSVVREFLASGESEAVVEVDAPKGSLLYGIDPICVRLVRVERRGDEAPWVLATSLVADEFTAADIIDAYRRRWRIEEYYKSLVANYFEQGQFHAKWVGGVRQEIYAQMLFVAIARTLMASAARKAGVPYRHLSTKGAILAVGDHLTRLILRSHSPHAARNHLRRLLRRIAHAIEKPRPGRRFPRRSLRPEPRWGPNGRNWKR